jgi:DNA-binding HxlR family transcriptional regulator
VSNLDVFLADCPARTTLSLIGDTWSAVVVMGLGERPMRYTALQARIGGISKKMLTQTLRRLQDSGLVARSEPGPAGAQYRLTPLGETLLDPVRVLAGWAEAHTDEVLAARSAAPAG